MVAEKRAGSWKLEAGSWKLGEVAEAVAWLQACRFEPEAEQSCA
jgi:hypothetical protein